MRITIKHLKLKCERLNERLERPTDAYTTVDGKLTANPGNYHISQGYRGYCLHETANDRGGVHDVFSTGHIPARDLANRIDAMLVGIRTITGN